MKGLKTKLLIFLCLLWVGFSCQDENIGDYPPANMRSIVRFALNPAQNGGNVRVQHVATIDQSQKVIRIELPADIDLTTIKPEITISPWATVSPQNLEEVNLSGNMEYTVVAESGKTAVYSVEKVFTYKYAGALIYAVIFPGITDPDTGEPFRGTFPGNTRTITMKLPQGTDLTQLIPEFETSPDSHNATFDNLPGKPYDFTEPVAFTITSENGANSVTYSVSVEIE